MVSRGKIKRKARVIDYYYKQGGKCAYCKIGMTLSLGFQNTATIDHIIPKAHKRIKGVFNEVAACQKCNNIKGCKPLNEVIGFLAADFQ